MALVSIEGAEAITQRPRQAGLSKGAESPDRTGETFIPVPKGDFGTLGSHFAKELKAALKKDEQ